MPLGRRHERLVLIAALLLASAGVSVVGTVEDTPASHAAPDTTLPPTTTTSTVPAPTTSTTAAPRIWPEVTDCVHAEPDRPAILSYSITNSNGIVPIALALRLTKAAGIPQDNLVRQGAAFWMGYAEAAGTVGSLVGPARKLVAARTDDAWTSATLYCARHNRYSDQLWVVLRPDADPAALPGRHGFADIVNNVTQRDAHGTIASLTTFAPLALEHAVTYLGDPDVLAVLPSPNCPVGATSGVPVPKHLLPTSTSSSTSSTTSTSTTWVHGYPSGTYNDDYCGLRVT
jgi:hypothetical protein